MGLWLNISNVYGRDAVPNLERRCGDFGCWSDVEWSIPAVLLFVHVDCLRLSVMWMHKTLPRSPSKMAAK
jgi:hypothetical protein